MGSKRSIVFIGKKSLTDVRKLIDLHVYISLFIGVDKKHLWRPYESLLVLL